MKKLKVVIFTNASSYKPESNPDEDGKYLREHLKDIAPGDFINLAFYPNFDRSFTIVLAYKFDEILDDWHLLQTEAWKKANCDMKCKHK